jgi:hypothetical protein
MRSWEVTGHVPHEELGGHGSREGRRNWQEVTPPPSEPSLFTHFLQSYAANCYGSLAEMRNKDSILCNSIISVTHFLDIVLMHTLFCLMHTLFCIMYTVKSI